MKEADSTLRDVGIDCARGLAMALVVLSHNPALADVSREIGAWIFTFHVPAFFVISGALLRPDRFTALKSARRILTPFFVVGVLYVLLKWLLRSEEPGRAIMGLFWGTGATLPSAPMWFLPTLFVTLLLTVAIVRRGFGPTRPVVAVAVLAALLALTWMALQLPSPSWAEVLRKPGVNGALGWVWSIDLVPWALFFALAGYWATRAGVLARMPGWMVLPALAVVSICYLLGARTDMNMRVLQAFPFAIVAALAGSVAVYCLGLILARHPARPATRAFALIGQHSMLVLLLHIGFQNLGIKLVDKVFGDPSFAPYLQIGFGLSIGLIVPICLSIGVDALILRQKFRNKPAVI